MRLTEDARFLDAFFEGEFGRAAAALARRGVGLLDAGPDATLPTYYVPRRTRAIARADFELNLEDPAAVRESLARLWAGPESATLVDLAEKILALAPRYASVDETEDVSPFIYVMF
jgi:hypothetical protein